MKTRSQAIERHYSSILRVLALGNSSAECPEIIAINYCGPILPRVHRR